MRKFLDSRMEIISKLLALELHWGIKRFFTKSVQVLAVGFLLPLEIKIINPFLKFLGVTPRTTRIIRQLRKGRIAATDVGYSRETAWEQILLERNIMAKKPTAVEVGLVEKQIDKLDLLSEDKVCLVDIGCGAGLKALQIIKMLRRHDVNIVKYVAFDGQGLLAEAAEQFVYQEMNLRTERVVGDILQLRYDSLHFGEGTRPVFLFLGNTIEILDLEKVNRVLAQLAQRGTVLLGVRYRKVGVGGKKDVLKLKRFYTRWQPYILSRLPRKFRTFSTIHHRWYEKRTSIRQGVEIQLPKSARKAMKLSKKCWVQLVPTTRFRTLKQIESSLRSYCSVLSKDFRVVENNIQDQMVVYVLGRKDI